MKRTKNKCCEHNMTQKIVTQLVSTVQERVSLLIPLSITVQKLFTNLKALSEKWYKIQILNINSPQGVFHN